MTSIKSSSIETTEYDAIVVGAGYGGLIAGAILSRNGLRTLVVDEIDQVGARGGSSFYNGYWLDWGHRDGRDFGDKALVITEQGQYGRKAIEAAGADIIFVKPEDAGGDASSQKGSNATEFIGPIEPIMKVHLMPDEKVISMTSNPEGITQYATEVLNVPPHLANKFLETLGILGQEDPQPLMNVTFKEWLPKFEDEPIRKAFMLMVATMWSLEPEETSVGRFLQQLVQNPVVAYHPNDPEVGGMQGFMEPYARAIRKHGGMIELGLDIFEILVEEGAIRGIVTRDKSSRVQVFRSPVVVFAHPICDVFEVLDESLFPPDMVENARTLARTHADVASINLGLSRLPVIRATGQPDTYIGWNRVMRGAERDYGGGWQIPTLTSRKQAPPGKHLMCMDWGRSPYEPLKSIADLKDSVDTVLDYARQYYRDLDEVTEWITHHIVKAPVCIGFSLKAIPKAPVQSPTIKGLYFVGATTEVDGAIHDIDANSALQATSLVLREFRKGD